VITFYHILWGKWNGNNKSPTIKLKIVNLTDEAFVLLVLEHILDNWIYVNTMDYFLLKQKDIEEKIKVTGSDGCWVSHSQGAIQFGGWNIEATCRDSLYFFLTCVCAVAVTACKTMVSLILIIRQ